jgi:SAM-dependent methyltransferase
MTLGPRFDAEWRARFERFARTSRSEHGVSGWSAEGLARRFGLFKRLSSHLPLQDRARVLELGCGVGTYVRYEGGLGHRVVGVDFSVPTLRRAVEADPGQKGCYAAADGYALPFARDVFDLVVCIGVLQAASQPEALIGEIARVLRPSGFVIVEVLNAFEAPALARRLSEIGRRRPPRVRAYRTGRARRWLEAHEITVLRRFALYLPPRRWPTLGRLLDAPGVRHLIERTPGATMVGAHAFWLLGQKAA